MQEFDSFSHSAEIPLLEKKILVVEDEAVFAKAVSRRLNRVGYNAEVAGDLEDAHEQLEVFVPDLVLLDMRLPDGTGLDLLSHIRKEMQSEVPVLVMSAYGELEDAVSAMKLGASDYLKKPIDLDELLLNVEKVLDTNEVSKKLNYSKKREQYAQQSTVSFLGDCKQINTIRKQVERIASITQDAETIPPTVLILGETGTGKDVLARVLHENSVRNNKPFVHIDCASLPKELIESELFGHQKGAFTNAVSDRTGLIEAAEDGVVFLDEIGEIPLDLQAKLLAVLERRTLRRVGSTNEQSVSAWVIAATNRDLESLSQSGEFRSDLYYRLNVLSIAMPPLRERGNDIIVLAEYFVEQTAQKYGLDNVSFTAQATAALQAYVWPGNVREMKHLLERAVLLAVDGVIEESILGLNSATSIPNKATAGVSQSIEEQDDATNVLKDDITLGEAELSLIKQALEKCNGNVSKAARELGITRMALRYRIKKYNL